MITIFWNPFKPKYIKREYRSQHRAYDNSHKLPIRRHSGSGSCKEMFNSFRRKSFTKKMKIKKSTNDPQAKQCHRRIRWSAHVAVPLCGCMACSVAVALCGCMACSVAVPLCGYMACSVAVPLCGCMACSVAVPLCGCMACSITVPLCGCMACSVAVPACFEAPPFLLPP